MIAIDTSAIMAIVLDEPEADACIAALETEDELIISAGTMAEVLVVADRRNVGNEVRQMIDGLGCDIVTVTSAIAHGVAEAYSKWGKGVHPAGLNFGDCFAYQLARDRNCPLLFVGDNFTKTDVVRAIPAKSR